MLDSLIADRVSSVIENKDAVKALNVIHESCLVVPSPRLP